MSRITNIEEDEEQPTEQAAMARPLKKRFLQRRVPKPRPAPKASLPWSETARESSIAASHSTKTEYTTGRKRPLQDAFGASFLGGSLDESAPNRPESAACETLRPPAGRVGKEVAKESEQGMPGCIHIENQDRENSRKLLLYSHGTPMETETPQDQRFTKSPEPRQELQVEEPCGDSMPVACNKDDAEILASVEEKPIQRRSFKKSAVLELLPESLKSLFGTVGFCQRGKRHAPAKVVSPYSLPKGHDVREEWKEQFHMLRETELPLDQLSFLVCWYGELDSDCRFCLVPQSDFVPYEKASSKMLNYARKAQLKRDSQQSLSKSEARRIREMEEMLDELRVRGCQIRDADSTDRVHPTERTENSQPDDAKDQKVSAKPAQNNPASEKVVLNSVKPLPDSENNAPVVLKKRPRGRPPLGKVWDPVAGIYVLQNAAKVPDEIPRKVRESDEKHGETNPQSAKQPGHVLQPASDTPTSKSPKHPSDTQTTNKPISELAETRQRTEPLKKRKRAVTESPETVPVSAPSVQLESSTKTAEADKGKHPTSKSHGAKSRERLERLLAIAVKDAKALLEREKAEVKAALPQCVTQKFGQVGFAKWGKEFLPALVMNPFQVPPGEARDTWMELFHEVKCDPRSLKRMSLLVFWYGELQPCNFYSLVPKSAFCPYDDATEKMLDYSKKAEQKRAAMKKLADDDKQRIRAMQELYEDLAKDAPDRKRGSTFKERHELLSLEDMEDIQSDDDDDGSAGDDDDGYSSLEDSEADLNDEREHLSSSSDDDGDYDDGDSDEDGTVIFEWDESDSIAAEKRKDSSVQDEADNGGDGKMAVDQDIYPDEPSSEDLGAPALSVFTKIVKQVCQERDSALQKVSTLEALLEKQQTKVNGVS